MNDSFAPFLEQLQHDLGESLPGRNAQYAMAPQPRPGAEIMERPEGTARRGGVLILFYPHDDQLFIPLILRPDYDGVHGGQVGLPGGGYEEEDGDLETTALRETFEEIGVASDRLQILGHLSPLYIAPSNFSVQPTVACIDHRPSFHPDPHEVAELIEAPLLAFLDPDNKRYEEWRLRDRTATVPFYHVQEQTIWGATAMMLSELFTLPAMEFAPGLPPHFSQSLT